MDLTGDSPLVGFRTMNFMMGRVVLKIASSKVVKYEKLCFDNQHAFVFEIFCFIVPNVVDFCIKLKGRA